MVLETYLRDRLKNKDILLMTHIVLGYPCFEDCFRLVEVMIETGVDLMELQIPFSEPVADGPVILRANQIALRQGVTVRECLDFAEKVAQTFDIPFLIMTYYNISFKYGVDRFVASMAGKGLRGAIIPDLPPEEGHDYLKAMQTHNLAPVLIFAPNTSARRMKYLGSLGRGFVYCVSRKGVTGRRSDFSGDFVRYIARCREATDLPLAVGFGVKERAYIDFLTGKANIAVIGTQTIRIMEKDGVAAVGDFIRGLRKGTT
jgi:tryptophan synthase alpha chain